MPLEPRNVQVKFLADPFAAHRARKIAAHHSLGSTSAAREGSIHEFAKLVFTQLSLVRPGDLYPALAALRPFQVKDPFALDRFGPKKVQPKP